MARGMEQGDRIATLAWNNRRHLELYFGVSGAGMVCHTINPRLSPEHLAYIINHASDRFLFLESSFVPRIAALRDQLPSLRGVCVCVCVCVLTGVAFFIPFLTCRQDKPASLSLLSSYRWSRGVFSCMGFVAGTLRYIDESNTNWMAMLNSDVDLLQYLVW